MSNLVGRYLKCISSPYSSVSVGCIHKIKSLGSSGKCYNTEDIKSGKEDHWCLNRWEGENPNFELMPEGWSPEGNTGAWIPKVGEWIISKADYATLYKGIPSKILSCTSDSFLLKEGSFGKSAWVNFRKALPSEISTKDLSPDELLAIAKERYPVGTKFRCIHINGKPIAEVSNCDIDNRLVIRTQDGTRCIYDPEIGWAEIVELSPAAQLIKESQQMYAQGMNSDIQKPYRKEKPRIILLDDSELLSVNVEKETKVKLLEIL